MKPTTLLFKLIAAMLVMSGLLSACSPKPVTTVEENATAVSEATAIPQPTTEPTAIPEPTLTPTPEPLDYMALFSSTIAEINPAKRFLNAPPATLVRELAGIAPFVLDVREVAEIEALGYIEGAVNIPVRDLMKNLDKLPALDAPIVVISDSGHRSGLVLTALLMLGYSNVRTLEGGMQGWIADSRPVVTGMPAAPAAISTPVSANQQLWAELDVWFSSLPDDFYSLPSEKLNEILVGSAAPSLIDLRKPADRNQAGYIKGALNIPLPELMTSLDQLPDDKTAPLVVFCATGFRGAVATMALQFLGYTDVHNLAGGMNAWKAAQPPLEFYVGWLPAKPLPDPMAGGLVQCPEDPENFYLVGGVVDDFYTSDQLYRYDIGSETWQRLANLPKATRGAGFACYQGNIYVAGGWDEALYDNLFIYNIAADTWSEGMPLPEPVWGVGLGAWDGKLYLVGGNRGADNLAPVRTVDVYDIGSNAWTAGGAEPMPTASGFYASVQVGAYLYVVGGWSGDFEKNVTQTQRFDMSTNTWEVGPTFTSARAVGALQASSSHLYFLGGDLNGGDIIDSADAVDVLDLTTWPEGAWVAGVPLPSPNIYLATFCSETSAGAKIWNIGGAYTSETRWEMFDAVYYLLIGEGCP